MFIVNPVVVGSNLDDILHEDEDSGGFWTHLMAFKANSSLSPLCKDNSLLIELRRFDMKSKMKEGDFFYLRSGKVMIASVGVSPRMSDELREKILTQINNDVETIKSAECFYLAKEAIEVPGSDFLFSDDNEKSKILEVECLRKNAQ